MSAPDSPCRCPSALPLRPRAAAGALLVAGLALAAVCGAGLSLPAKGPGPKKARPDPDAVLKKLLEGNKRFASGGITKLRGRGPLDFATLAKGQAPLAVIVACADSRVAPELIFDQGVGDLFVVRVAGNIVGGAGPVVKGSIEYAVAELGVRLIVVLGHSQCGAVKAAIEHIEARDKLPGSIGDLILPIGGALTAAKGMKGDKLNNVIKANVLQGVRRLEGLEPIISKYVRSKELKVVGGSYELSTGRVAMFD